MLTLADALEFGLYGFAMGVAGWWLGERLALSLVLRRLRRAIRTVSDLEPPRNAPASTSPTQAVYK